MKNIFPGLFLLICASFSRNKVCKKLIVFQFLVSLDVRSRLIENNYKGTPFCEAADLRSPGFQAGQSVTQSPDNWTNARLQRFWVKQRPFLWITILPDINLVLWKSRVSNIPKFSLFSTLATSYPQTEERPRTSSLDWDDTCFIISS